MVFGNRPIGEKLVKNGKVRPLWLKPTLILGALAPR
jgi:hypothetical protein